MILFGALKNVKITRIIKSHLWRGTFANVDNTLALSALSRFLVVYHLEPEMLKNLTNVINLE